GGNALTALKTERAGTRGLRPTRRLLLPFDQRQRACSSPISPEKKRVMPRRVRVRHAGEEPRAGGDDERRPSLSPWKERAVEHLPQDTPRPLKVQLRADIDRALAHFRPGDDEEEVRDVVESAIEDIVKRLASMAADQRHRVSKKALIVLAPAFLNIA